MMRTSPAAAPPVRAKAAKTAGKPPAAGARSAGEVPRPLPRRQAPWLRLALVFAICALLLDALFGDRGLAETLRARAEYAAAAADLQRVKTENAGLREQIRRLEHDPVTIEALARRELGFIRPGEILVIVRDVKQPGPVAR
jgi:cell division protein FtsB